MHCHISAINHKMIDGALPEAKRLIFSSVLQISYDDSMMGNLNIGSWELLNLYINSSHTQADGYYEWIFQQI